MKVDPERLQSLFLEALEHPPGPARASFLDRMCPDDAALRGRVEALLHASQEPAWYLDAPVVASLPIDAPAADRVPGSSGPAGPDARWPDCGAGPGDRIGPYRLLERLGEGSMGVVFLAEQASPLHRRVALKILQPGLDGRHILDRFDAERRALALMDHPNIARVIDVGTIAGDRPYFVMELVDGPPITEHCDEHGLTTRERLELFLPLCLAIQHAHQNGIIHRDIKPNNVLVAHQDGRPVPKVIDFGVAKAIDGPLAGATVLTQIGLIVGTLEYMSPEQAELSERGVDTRSDIYSLGVLLYELLTGSTPLERSTIRGCGYSEILARIREEDPPRPSGRLRASREALEGIAARRGTEPARLCGQIRGELDWIVMKALDKDRARRYDSAGSLARDLRRFLDGDIVEACPPSARYLLAKYGRKHLPGLLTFAAFLALLLLTALMGFRQAARATRAEAVAVAEGRRARQSAAESQAVLGFFHEQVLGKARPAGPVGALGEQVTVHRALDAAEPRISEAFADRPLVEASVRAVFASTYLNLGDRANALRQWERVHELKSDHEGPGHPDTLAARADVAMALWQAGQLDRAISLLERTLDTLVETLGAAHPEALTRQHDLAMLYQLDGRLERCIELLSRTISGREATLGGDHPDTLESRAMLANTHRLAGQYDLALALSERTLEAMAARLGVEHPRVISVRNTLAGVHRDMGHHDRAIAIAEQTLRWGSLLMGPDSPRMLTTRVVLAMAYQEGGRLDRAVSLLERATAGLERSAGPLDPETLGTRVRLAAAYRDAGRFEEAVAILEPATEDLAALLGPENLRTVVARTILGDTYRCAGRLEPAASLLESNAALEAARLGDDHPETLQARHCLALVLRESGRLEPAARLMERTLVQRGNRLGPEHPATLATRFELAQVCQFRGDRGRAEPLLREVLEARRRRLGVTHPDVARTAVALARLLIDGGDRGGAEPLLRSAVAIWDERRPDDWRRFEAVGLLGAALASLGRTSEAAPLIAEGEAGLASRAASVPAGLRSGLATGGGRPLPTAGREDRLFDVSDLEVEGDGDS